MAAAVIRPNLFVVGQPKSGTTALQKYLAEHPAIFMTTPKEPHYFCRDFHGSSDEFHGRQLYYDYRTEREWLSLFERAAGERVQGEASTSYLYSRDAAAGIYAFNREARIIMMLREPVSFLASLHSHYFRATLEDAPTVASAWRAETERRGGRGLPARVRAPELVLYSERVRYWQQLQRYLTLFPREQIKVVLFEDFRRDNEGTLADVLNFLGVEPAPAFHSREVNTNSAPRWPRLNRWLLAPALKQRLRQALSPAHYERLISIARLVLWQRAPAAPVAPALAAEIWEACHDEVEKLGHFLGRDLAVEWGAPVRS